MFYQEDPFNQTGVKHIISDQEDPMAPHHRINIP